MSDRNLLELRRAYQQRIDALEQRVRQLSLHAYPGAPRSGQLASFETMTDVPQTVITAHVNPGRWLVWHRGICTIEGTTAGTNLTLRTGVPGGPVVTTPWVTGWVIGASTIPFCDFGEFEADEMTDVTLQVWGSNYDTAVWSDLSLLCVPV